MLIYGFSNGFYRWNIFVGVPTSEVLGQALNILHNFKYE
ncbi:hypothetical protein LEP1GSC103_0941 [Leptospira borgpetersenii serovar Javanica str. UI 09931]|uniref:Uncharacterized protein n=5 Tax=Leptospira borgpetersenii TaxID=174 RepID=M3GKV2_LEPBO|nr:hypothetical protein LBBP_00476 [Leptospira borgpetersenii serovar Ballum]EKP12370.1 hypothetical protein LEP1GSC128_4112 [Leptospira borgpetersenii str. 200801926]EKQ91392.1 hypothetical protein LEP1GSC101_1379 [Leptospira borgpetersenii str. UI 09149]EKR02179.1 hypothetical protein LEP1GSC121_0770 [Leptospira borgpetersenii serovar Castellonis str. 200801910]EMG01632.1 hypothetical protein LEP1GSC123_4000 [Leptospira borgpetersenii str. 200701203]EMK10994.1 hypothetical protein LEP1GSC066